MFLPPPKSVCFTRRLSVSLTVGRVIQIVVGEFWRIFLEGCGVPSWLASVDLILVIIVKNNNNWLSFRIAQLREDCHKGARQLDRNSLEQNGFQPFFWNHWELNQSYATDLPHVTLRHVRVTAVLAEFALSGFMLLFLLHTFSVSQWLILGYYTLW